MTQQPITKMVVTFADGSVTEIFGPGTYGHVRTRLRDEISKVLHPYEYVTVTMKVREDTSAEVVEPVRTADDRLTLGHRSADHMST